MGTPTQAIDTRFKLKFAPGNCPPDPVMQNYGLGWRIDTSTGTLGGDRPVQLIHHDGTQMGGVAFWAIYPEFGVSVTVVANTGDVDVRGACSLQQMRRSGRCSTVRKIRIISHE